MHLSDFDYELPETAIARVPVDERDASRLLVLDRRDGSFRHEAFRDLPGHLEAGDALVLNETRVRRARLAGRRRSGGAVELLVLAAHEGGGWVALAKPARRLRPGEVITLEGSPDNAPGSVHVVERLDGGRFRVEVRDASGEACDPERYGEMPLPPYIDRRPSAADRERYQTVYARESGAVAAPTAGLHFTNALLESVAAKGVEIVRVLLHVGAGTFRPVTVEDVRAHRMEAEFYRYPPEAAATLRAVRGRGGRVVAVGTTSVRVLETVGPNGEPGDGWTDLYLHAPHAFTAVDAIVTNFHLPRSTLLVLVAAFAGRERVLRAYEAARDLGYRFYSYGDAMLIL